MWREHNPLALLVYLIVLLVLVAVLFKILNITF